MVFDEKGGEIIPAEMDRQESINRRQRSIATTAAPIGTLQTEDLILLLQKIPPPKDDAIIDTPTRRKYIKSITNLERAINVFFTFTESHQNLFTSAPSILQLENIQYIYEHMISNKYVTLDKIIVFQKRMGLGPDTWWSTYFIKSVLLDDKDVSQRLQATIRKNIIQNIPFSRWAKARKKRIFGNNESASINQT